MAQLAAFLPYILAAGGTLLQGSGQNASAKAEAAQLQHQAGQERAASQRAAAEQRRSARYMQSRAQALAAASGAGASDPTVVDILSDIEGEGEYGALAAMYEGESGAKSKEVGAKLARAGGSAAQAASYISAGTTLLGGASSWYDKYGGRRADQGIYSTRYA